jgi:hypothetical protein
MKALMRLAMRLYPAAWRARYGEELEALVEDIGPAQRDVWNVLGGALRMQLSIWNSWKLIPTLAVAGAAVMAVTAFSIRTEYMSSGVVQITGVSSVPQFAHAIDRLRTDAVSRAECAEIVAEEGLYPGVPPEEAIVQFQRNLLIVPFARTAALPSGQERWPQALMLRFHYSDPGKAQRVVGRLMGEVMAANLSEGISVRALDPASPSSPIWPNRPGMVAMGTAAGLLLGTLCLMKRWRQALLSGALVSALAVGMTLVKSTYPQPRSAWIALAVLGFLIGLGAGLLAVGLRRLVSRFGRGAAA